MSGKPPKLGPIYSVAKPIPLVSRYLHTHCFFPSLPNPPPEVNPPTQTQTQHSFLVSIAAIVFFSLIPNTYTLLALHSMIIIGIFTLGALSDTNDIFQTDIISLNIQVMIGLLPFIHDDVISTHRILRWSQRNQTG